MTCAKHKTATQDTMNRTTMDTLVGPSPAGDLFDFFTNIIYEEFNRSDQDSYSFASQFFRYDPNTKNWEPYDDISNRICDWIKEVILHFFNLSTYEPGTNPLLDFLLRSLSFESLNISTHIQAYLEDIDMSEVTLD